MECLQLKCVKDHIRLKDPKRHQIKLLELLQSEEEESTQQPGQKDDPFECYYCIVFLSTTNKEKYEEHVNLNHPGLPTYPSLADLKRLGTSSQGRKWEI